MATDAEDRPGRPRPDPCGVRPSKRGPVTGRLARIIRVLGPGLVTGSADDDPSAIATYAQAGALYSHAALWTIPITLPLMMAVQEISDRTALATGESLGHLVRRRFPARVQVIVGVMLTGMLMANILNIGADLMAIGQGMELLGAGPNHLWSALAGIGIMIMLITNSAEMISRIFKWLCLSLLAYVAVMLVTRVDWGSVAAGMSGQQFRFDQGYLGIIVAIFGTSISPYLFFWQSADRVQELRAEDTPGQATISLDERGKTAAKRKLRTSRADVFTGMGFSQLIVFCIVVATGATLGQHGTQIKSAADAAKALEPIAGAASSVLFAAGFIGSGILAIPVLAGSASIGCAALLNKNWGFDRDPRKAPVFYGLVIVGTVAGVLLGLLYPDPFSLLVFVAVVNGIAAAPFVIVLMLISGSRGIMGEHRNGKLATTLGWITAAVMAGAGTIGIWQIIVAG
ncbi:Nramp family divalent metal transporter [bacterium RCC_150]